MKPSYSFSLLDWYAGASPPFLVPATLATKVSFVREERGLAAQIKSIPIGSFVVQCPPVNKC
jgi:hypothetical protein